VLYDKFAANERTNIEELPFKRDLQQTGTQIRQSNLEFHNVAVETPAVNTSSGFTAAERAAAVVSTSVEGAKAGVNVSPFALARSEKLRGLSFTVAAFDEGVTRFGAAARSSRQLPSPIRSRRPQLSQFFFAMSPFVR
jgi:hypothetical protein